MSRADRTLRVEAEPAFRTEHANPYNARLYRSMLAIGGIEVRDLSYLRLLLRRTDIVHLHWPTLTFLSGHRRWRVMARLLFFFGFLKVARLRGTRLVWTVHNVESHERRSTPRLRAVYRRLLLGNVDAIIGLSESNVVAARSAYPELADTPALVTPHGHYRDDYEFSLDRAEARAMLGLDPDATLVASVGQIRDYKNVPHLMRVFAAVEDDRALLVVAGRPASPELAAEVATCADLDGRVVLDAVFQSPERMSAWLRASDVVVLPYRAIQNSGSAMLSLSADRPVLVPDLGGMQELRAAVGGDWVRCYTGDLTPAALADAIQWSRRERPAEAPLDAFDWSSIARSTLDVYRTTLATSRPAHPTPVADLQPAGSRS